MKRQIALVVCLIFVLSIWTPASMAQMKIDVRINNVLIGFDSTPFIRDGRTMVPVRAIAESLGASRIEWNQEYALVTIGIGEEVLRMVIGSKIYHVGEVSYEMDVAPEISEDRTMVPARFVAEAFGCDVGWDDVLRTVEIYKDGIEVPEANAVEDTYTSEDILWLARIINVEGLDIGYEAKLGIANVVLNRVKGDLYPDTVYDVIMDDAYAIQFPPAHRSSFASLEPDEQSWLVAKDALKGANNVEDCLYFNNAPFKWKADELFLVIEGEYFYK